ncbi:hypothetical protein WKW79_20515 [Variovorax robiniae]|uniref:Uncharacterized protein n=1 Tax=Variovorax robiniae TaxID=1836199 RepID=A0ABU8XBI9_9BURK
MFRKNQTPKADTGRPSESTPYGVLYTDTAAFTHFAEVRRIRDWLASFLDDMEQLRVSAPDAVKRIDGFWDTLPPQCAYLKSDTLARIRASLNGDSEIYLGAQLSTLRRHALDQWGHGVSGAAHACESVPTGHERPYTGPFPRGPQEPAFGYQRALMSGNY